MQSKEEIEKIKRGLTEELNGTIRANECGLSTNDFSEDIEILRGALNYINQLETDNQKLIEKLEEDIKITKEQYSENTLLNIRVDGKLDTLEEILKILKGENDE